MNLKVVIEAGEDGYYVASVPALKGCWSQGKTRDEALKNIREAIELYLEPDEMFRQLVAERSSSSPYEIALALWPASR